MKEVAISYHDVLLRNGFENNDPFLYTKELLVENKLIYVTVEVHTSFWTLKYSGNNKPVRLNTLIFSKDHDTMEERNEDVNNLSLINLKKAFAEMGIDMVLI